MKSILALWAAASLAACASQSGVVPMGQGTYMVARQAATGIPGLGNLKAESLREADAFCAGRSQEMEVLSAVENEGPFVMGKYPRAEVQFRCKGR